MLSPSEIAKTGMGFWSALFKRGGSKKLMFAISWSLSCLSLAAYGEVSDSVRVAALYAGAIGVAAYLISQGSVETGASLASGRLTQEDGGESGEQLVDVRIVNPAGSSPAGTGAGPPRPAGTAP